MIVRRVYYLLLLAAGGYFAMLYNFQGLRFLLCCIVLFPLVSFLFLIPGKFLCRVDLSVKGDTVSRGEPVEFAVKVKNRGLFPISRVLIRLCWKAPGEKAVRVRHFLRCPGSGEILPLELSAVHCGAAYLILEKARVYDYFGLFSLSTGGGKRAEICVTPLIEAVSSDVPEAGLLRGLDMAGEEGDLLLRDFQPGDSLRRIYWQMTARGGELQVKDFEKEDSLKIFLNFSPQFRQQAEKWDVFLDRVCSLMAFWSNENGGPAGSGLEIVWARGEEFVKYGISGPEAVQAWVCALLKGEDAGTFLSEEEISGLSGGYHLEEDGGLYFGEQCVYEEAGSFI